MGYLRVLSSAVAWQPWTAAVFARARDERKPVLLAITASWCASCHEMDRTSYADPTIATLINEGFVPIRIDADERPDIADRYTLGGWPTTAFLTPEGQVLTGGTFVSVERMPSILAQVAEAFKALDASGLRELTRAAAESDAAPVAGAAVANDAALSAHVFETFDPRHGGFGVEPKFPLTAPLELALQLCTAGNDEAAATMLVATLDGMGWSPLYDDIDGGFFRYATTRDWQLPHFEKRLDVNAALTSIYLKTGAALKISRFTDRGGDTLRFIQTWLADPVDGGWRGSQHAEADYYESGSAEGRRARPAPAVSPALYADSNAVMVQTALHAAGVFGDDGLREFAIKSLERVLTNCYRPGSGVAHYFDGQPHVRGLLADQLEMAAACLDTFDATGNVVYEMMAEELAHYALRVLWDDVHGGFFDRARDETEPPIGLLEVPLKPFVANCDASRTLRRLADASGEREFAAFADRTLAAMRPLAMGQGPLAAHYLLALRDAAPR
jgi:uncharacterized protein YyaL (SSP411 family)